MLAKTGAWWITRVWGQAATDTQLLQYAVSAYHVNDVTVKDHQHPFVGNSYCPSFSTVEQNRSHHCLVDPTLCTQRYFTLRTKTGLETRECRSGLWSLRGLTVRDENITELSMQYDQRETSAIYQMRKGFAISTSSYFNTDVTVTFKVFIDLNSFFVSPVLVWEATPTEYYWIYSMKKLCVFLDCKCSRTCVISRLFPRLDLTLLAHLLWLLPIQSYINTWGREVLRIRPTLANTQQASRNVIHLYFHRRW